MKDAFISDNINSEFQIRNMLVKGGDDREVRYTLGNLKVYRKPDVRSKILSKINTCRWITVKSPKVELTHVILPTGLEGYVSGKYLASKWIKVWKAERKLFLMSGRDVIEEFSIGLGFNPAGDKIRLGDGCTPVGRFYICEMIANPKQKEKYGARSMRISYPDIEDARRGLKDKIISKAQYLAIVKAVKAGKMPPQNTKLGGSIRIHGGGSGSDWTLGCIALEDADIINLYDKLPPKNTMVEVYYSASHDELINNKTFPNAMILRGAKELFKMQCRYTSSATAIIPLAYPMGDFDKKMGVCTDVVIRALRYGNVDLQALLYEDIITNPKRYKKIPRPNANIDHRRTRNLKIWFDHHAKVLTNDSPDIAPQKWQPGDIVIMDTGVENGTIYDHIGIVSSNYFKGRPLVINLWTIGHKLEEMDLLDGEYPKIVGHYRMLHGFDYNTVPIIPK